MLHGVLVPGLVRPKQDGSYEMVAGHRRKMASRLAGKTDMDCIVRELTDEEAIIIMVDSNLQREQILPSEKAFAYKMKLDAMRRQAGRPSKDNSVPVGQNFGVTSREVLAANSPDSNTQIQRYIRLTYLIPELLEMVDNSVTKDKELMQIALRPAVELSYLTKEEQHILLDTMELEDCTPSHAQAINIYSGGVLRYAKGEVVDTVTTLADKPVESIELYLGKYTIVETKASYGTVLNIEPKDVELTYAGQEVEITEIAADMVNERQKAIVTLTKDMEQDLSLIHI